MSTKQDGNDHKETYDCPKCKDQNGYIGKDETGYDVWKRCDCLPRKRVDKLFKSSYISEKFRSLSFDNFSLKGKPQIIHDIFECAKAYCDDFESIRKKRQNSIALMGQPGIGKTHLLIAIANTLLNSGIGVQYFPWVEGLNDLKSNFDEFDRKIKAMQNIPVLFLDDLYKPGLKISEFQVGTVLYQVVNYRYLNYLPIMVSSEHDFNKLCEVDEALGSRIYEMCGDYTVFTPKDRKLNHRLGGM